MVDLHDTYSETAGYWVTATPEVPAGGGNPNQTVSVGLGTRDGGRLIWRVYLRDGHGEPAREGMANIVIHRIPLDEPRGN